MNSISEAALSMGQPDNFSKKLILTTDTTHCRFWLSFYSAGPMESKELSGLTDPITRLDKAVDVGLNEKEAVMWVQESLGKLRYEVLIPFFGDFIEAAMVASSTLAKCKPTELGFYLSPKLFSNGEAAEVVVRVLSLLNLDAYSNIYLFIGGFGLNNMVNIASDVGTRCEEPLLIFH